VLSIVSSTVCGGPHTDHSPSNVHPSSSSLLRTLVIQMFARVVRDPTSSQSSLVRPFRGVLRLPRPVDPAFPVVLPGLSLGVVVVSEESFVFAVGHAGTGGFQDQFSGSGDDQRGTVVWFSNSLGETLPTTSVPFPTVPDIVRTGVRPIVPRSHASSVQPLGTIVRGQTPFPYDRPGWGCSEVPPRVASRGEVLAP
jgi:hypothetical protein